MPPSRLRMRDPPGPGEGAPGGTGGRRRRGAEARPAAPRLRECRQRVLRAVRGSRRSDARRRIGAPLTGPGWQPVRSQVRASWAGPWGSLANRRTSSPPPPALPVGAAADSEGSRDRAAAAARPAPPPAAVRVWFPLGQDPSAGRLEPRRVAEAVARPYGACPTKSPRPFAPRLRPGRCDLDSPSRHHLRHVRATPSQDGKTRHRMYHGAVWYAPGPAGVGGRLAGDDRAREVTGPGTAKLITKVVPLGLTQ
jgi:hypothetical protein